MARKAPQYVLDTGFESEILNLQACAYTTEALHYSIPVLLMGGY